MNVRVTLTGTTEIVGQSMARFVEQGIPFILFVSLGDHPYVVGSRVFANLITDDEWPSLPEETVNLVFRERDIDLAILGSTARVTMR
jgi:hypothetical protein